MRVTFDGDHASEDCGCPEEHWIISGILVILHSEGDGSGHALLLGDEWEQDFIAPAPADFPHMLLTAYNLIDAMPTED